MALVAGDTIDALMRRVDAAGGEEGTVGSAEAIKACIEVNRKLQEAQKIRLAKIDAALALNTSTQTRIRNLVAQAQKERKAERQATARGGRPHRTPGKPFFVDAQGAHPPKNPDAELRATNKSNKMPLVYTMSKWNDETRKKLVKNVRSVMLKVVMENQLESMEAMTPDQVVESGQKIASMTDEELVRATAGKELNWEEVVKLSGLKRSAAACRVQWATVDDPTIRHPDVHKWTKEEDIKLIELAQKNENHDWEAIAAELGTSRTATACITRFNRSLNGGMQKTGQHRSPTQTEP